MTFRPAVDLAPMPRALDLFCGAGGATKGLQRSGFHVTGVDIKKQPRYCGDLFVQADALNPPFDLSQFDFIWASPPCQAYSATSVWHKRDRPDLLAATRTMLHAASVPWAIENVPGAPMRADYILCGSQFGERRLRRHRWFEVTWDAAHLVPSCDHGKVVTICGHGGPAGGKFHNSPAVWRDVLGIDWMNRDELAQAIPPSYGEFIGRAALQYIDERQAA